jgi:hypothetical protein
MSHSRLRLNNPFENDLYMREVQLNNTKESVEALDLNLRTPPLGLLLFTNS